MRIHRFFLALCFLALTSCSANEPFYVFNGSDGAVMVEVDGRSYTIEQGATKKICGLHYSGGAITYSNGAKKIYNESLKNLLASWHSLRGNYICNGLWSAEVHVHITTSNFLELQPCFEKGKAIILEPDNT